MDEFLLRSKNFVDLRVARRERQNPVGNQDQKIKFHPHCHQRAEGLALDGIASGANASVELLRACGFDVELSEAGCCGMAGTFGFEAEHYDVSMKIFERLETGDWRSRGLDIASTGAACRMQIQHGLGAEARHPIEWVREGLMSGK